MRFKLWLENKVFKGVNSSDIDWWSKYAQLKLFSSEVSAREWIFQKRQFADRQTFAQVVGVDGEDYNRQFANTIPIYKSGNSFKIGKRIRKDNMLKLKDIQVKIPEWEYVVQTAQACGNEFKVHKIKWIPIRYTVSDQDYYLINEKDRIQNLALQIKNNKWIEAVIYDYKNLNILEGQHRARAMKVLGFATVPGVGIEYKD